jgi:hypothetical protein
MKSMFQVQINGIKFWIYPRRSKPDYKLMLGCKYVHLSKKNEITINPDMPLDQALMQLNTVANHLKAATGINLKWPKEIEAENLQKGAKND